MIITVINKENQTQDKVPCIACGKLITPLANHMNLCTKCKMDWNFKIKIDNENEIIPAIEQILDYFATDVTEAFHKDPAANSLIEILTSYPGIQAVLLYRVAHFFWILGVPFIPRYLSNLAHQYTGIDIHPGAKIGKHFFIDHGSGVVIGETTEIGNNVTLFQNVTLGGTSIKKEKRHPTLGNNIIIGAGAKILGPVIIGNNVKIGANSVVTKNVPSNSIAVGVPARIIHEEAHISEQISSLSHGILPDPVANLIQSLENRISDLEKKMNIKKT
ncbi:serine O-acetyltransferase [Candidatus Harpocratesius sp.]